MPNRPVFASVYRNCYLCNMLAYENIERLEALVSKFLNKETYSHSLSTGSRERELDNLFKSNTDGIIKDLEKDYDFLFQQDCDITIDGFREEMSKLQERVESLKALMRMMIWT